ncbi:hypothetical protein HA402_012620 [Bradysia odoriphaga]|nr:hypothetical protein HA402_012620 [Bradysia odoriphaga]
MGDFEWPWEYNFPPFFTIQLHGKTRELQLSVWAGLVLKYFRHNRQTQFTIGDESVLFANQQIQRKLSNDGIQLILEELEKSGNAAPVDKKKLQWEIYWHPLDEWGNIIYKWASDNGMTNTVCTLFEISQGENSVNEEFYGLDQSVLVKALKTLQAKQRCELFDDNEGVKFF